MGLNIKTCGLGLVTYFMIIASVASVCIPVNYECIRDSQCCGHPTNKAVRCERRALISGKKCYLGYGIGFYCSHDHDCTSQKCRGGICKKRIGGHKGPELPDCPLITQVGDVIDVVDGGISNCACDKSRTTSVDIKNSLLVKNNVGYTNNYSVGMSGVIIEPTNEIPFEEIEFCPSPGSADDDPTIWKLEARSERSVEYANIQSGEIFKNQRTACESFKIVDRQFWYRYKITIGDRRGGFQTGCSSICSATCPSIQDFNPSKYCFLTPTTQFGPLELVTNYPRYDSNAGETVFLYQYENTDNISKNLLMLQHDGSCCLSISNIYYIDESGIKQIVQSLPSSLHDTQHFIMSCLQGTLVGYSSDRVGFTYYVEYRVTGEYMVTKTVNYAMTNYAKNKIEFGTVSGPSCQCSSGQSLAAPANVRKVSRKMQAGCTGDYPVTLGCVHMTGKCNKLNGLDSDSTIPAKFRIM